MSTAVETTTAAVSNARVNSAVEWVECVRAFLGLSKRKNSK